MTVLQQRWHENWLVGMQPDRFQAIFYNRLQELNRLKDNYQSKILLCESNPEVFLASFMAACTLGYPIFLGDSNWKEAEWKEAIELIQPNLVWNVGVDLNLELLETISILDLPSISPSLTRIMIPTGGTSGKIRFAVHTWETLMASVRGFQEYFQVDRVNSCCLLPLYHVSGLMQFMRSFTTGGKLWILPKSKLESIEKMTEPNLKIDRWFISLVPTQLQRILNDEKQTNWLQQFDVVLLGGAPAWERLLEKARVHKIRLAPTYGMTETASQVVTLKPDDFLKGNQSCGQVLPHAHLETDSFSSDITLSSLITIQSKSLCLGYYSSETRLDRLSNSETLKSDDIGFLDDRGYLYIIGRCSDKIITGGENVFPAEVEAAIRGTGLVADICAIGIPDDDWGEAVVAVCVPKTDRISEVDLSTAISDKLSRYKQPKYWHFVSSLPRNERGKINRSQVARIARSGVKFLSRC
ncbi:2-succinylbenzoate--CoA ligase [Zarconia navalis]|uniref:2-succinylbenzoate--CoA ligase n=1 Tax=Zarconia navalis TaxID=2992134 RepID=UPI0021F8244C|nr:2-succinylbenzoate--CoA ligase [Zarconia navalis]